ncbi:MAG: hypothetical protein D6805_01465 [Planctomycetota bacterium]|nr:MAG: hypothetical protein D6805_01465 [Planctomycetota bacterium]
MKLKNFLKHPASTLTSSLLLSALAIVSSNYVQNKICALPEYKIQNNFENNTLPPWLNQQNISQLNPPKISLFQENLIFQLTYQYQQIPWIRKILSIQKSYPNHVQIKLKLRRPLCWSYVQKDKFFWDKDAFPIHQRYVHPKLQLPQIIGIPSPTTPSKKNLSAIQQACYLLHKLNQHNLVQKLHITKIDLSNIHGKINPKESEIVLLTKHNIAIEWGRSQLSTKPNPVPTSEKIQALQKILKLYPNLHHIQRIRLQFGQDNLALVLAYNKSNKPSLSR